MTSTAKQLRSVRRQIARGHVRVYGTDEDGWRHFPERSLIRLDALIEMQTELDALLAESNDLQGKRNGRYARW